jgi:glutathione S-transferase
VSLRTLNHRAAQGLFSTLLDRKAPPKVKAYILGKSPPRFDYLDSYLKDREFLLDHFSVANAYLVTALSWSQWVPQIELAKWPNLQAYYDRLRARPSVARAMAEEFELSKAEVARHKKAAA